MDSVADIIKELEKHEGMMMTRKLLVFVSPITGKLEYRVGYFLSNIEADIWEKELEKFYNKNCISYQVYTDTIDRRG